MSIHFEIEGRARPYSERQTTKVVRGKRMTWSYRSDSLKNWQAVVVWEAIRKQEQVPPPSGPIHLTLEFYFKRPMKTKSHKPVDEPYPTRFKRDADLTNLVKGVEDSLERILFENDVQVIEQVNRKRWSKTDRQYAVVTVREI